MAKHGIMIILQQTLMDFIITMNAEVQILERKGRQNIAQQQFVVLSCLGLIKQLQVAYTTLGDQHDMEVLVQTMMDIRRQVPILLFQALLVLLGLGQICLL